MLAKQLFLSSNENSILNTYIFKKSSSTLSTLHLFKHNKKIQVILININDNYTLYNYIIDRYGLDPEILKNRPNFYYFTVTSDVTNHFL